MEAVLPRRSLRSRRILRAFFAHRSWLLLCIAAGAGVAAAWSFTQERTYRGRLELASANETAPTRVLLPDQARLWQLVYSSANINLLTDGASESSESFDHVNRSIQLEPISVQPAGSSVWGLEIHIPAPTVAAARERLDRYAARIDSEFRERVLLVRRQRPMAPVAVRRTDPDQAARTPAVDGAVRRTQFSPADSTEAASELPTLPTNEAAADSVKADHGEVAELAKQLGVTVDQLPLVLDQFQHSIDDRVALRTQREQQVARAMEMINRAEANPLSAAIPADREALYPELVSLRDRRQQLLSQQSRLATYLKPAHPEFKAIDHDLQQIEDRIRVAQQEVVTEIRQEVGRWDSEIKTLRDSIVADRQRLAAVQAITGHTAMTSRTSAPTSFVEPSKVGEPTPAPAAPIVASPATTGIDRPIGRVVVRPGVIDVEPIRPKTVRNVLIGGLIGFLLYAFVSVIRANSDQRIHAVDDLESLDVPLQVFGSIPKLRSGSPVKFSVPS